MFRLLFFIVCLVGHIHLYGQNRSILVAGNADNDIVVLLRENKIPYKLFSSPDQAIAKAKHKDALLLLADNYPSQKVALSSKSHRRIKQKNLHVFIEYPEAVPGAELSAGTQKIVLERGIINSSRIKGVDSLSLLAIHDHTFIPATVINSHILLGKVAGFKKADYGIDDTKTYPLLFSQSPYLVSTTKISDVISSRFGPANSWMNVWNFILKELALSEHYQFKKWVADVKPQFTKEEKLPSSSYQSAIQNGADWFYKAKFFIHPQWVDTFQRRTKKNGEHVVFPGPTETMPVGDGSLGLLEGHASYILSDGSQPYRWWLRGDCQAEVAWALSASSNFLGGDPQYKKTAENLLTYLYKTSNLRAGERNDPKSPSFGLIGWATTDPDAYYGDDNARAILATIGAAMNLKSKEWNPYILEAIIGNFRTTGKKGFRGPWFRDAAMQKTTWQSLADRDIVNVHPHYESWLWACNLWLFDKTGYEPLLKKTHEAIQITMAAYPKWKWTNGIQQELARMVLPLAWLVRVEDTPQHREWLDIVVKKLVADMDNSGAIAEKLGMKGLGRYDRIASNKEYGTKEAPLISENGDPVADMLYTCNFALFALHEAAAATGNESYTNATKRLADFLIRIQISAPKHPDLNGAWVRAFDFNQWEYWASNADSGWGPWGTLTGWTQSWIMNGLMLFDNKQSFWDQTAQTFKNETFKKQANEKISSMMPEPTN
jgi:hypothetical protein